MEIEVFQEHHGWSYRVGAVYQPYHPEKEGFVPMSGEEAQQLAQVVYQRMTDGFDHSNAV